MTDIYTRSQATASKLMAKFAQGTIQYVQTEVALGANPWDPPSQTLVRYPMDATAKGVTAYQTDELVTINDLEITASVFEVEPVVGGIVEVDGKQRQILRVKRVPEAGTVVVWKVYVKG